VLAVLKINLPFSTSENILLLSKWEGGMIAIAIYIVVSVIASLVIGNLIAAMGDKFEELDTDVQRDI
jgi:hypothetical protein